MQARNSLLELNEVYFWTLTIYEWKKLLEQDKYKTIIIDSLQKLVMNKMISVYGFVIMPNHIHLIVELLSLNVKRDLVQALQRKLHT
jgi:REP element-mobilizing transposase RayT